MNNRQRIYEAIKAHVGWIDLDQLSAELLIDRTDLNNSVRSMKNTCPHKYPGLRVSSKPKSVKNKFGQRKSIHNIKYKYTGEE